MAGPISEETSQRYRVVGNTASDLISPEFEPQTYRTDSVCLTAELTRRSIPRQFNIIVFE